MLRRNFLLWGAGAAGVAVAGTVYYRRRADVWKTVYAQGVPYSSVAGILDGSIDVLDQPVQLDGQLARLYSFNGSIPGPAITVTPGDAVRLRLNNYLAEPTNLHFHGLHVAPTGHADNIFLEVPPGESLQYEFTVPRNHPAGMFWYHPHLHGRSEKQVSMGLAAPFLVRGDLDQLPEVAAAHEHLLVLQDFPSLNPGGNMAGMHEHGGGTSRVAVTGRYNPELTIAENGLARLRFLNASSSVYYRLTIEEHPMHVIATDGGGIPAPQAVDELLLVPGQRTEILVRGERPPGSYKILSTPSPGMMGEAEGSPAENSQPIAFLVYEGRSERVWDIPSRLIDVPALPAPTAPVRSFVLSGGGMMGGGMMGHGGTYSINGQGFDARRIDTTVRLDTVEDWEYINTSRMDHPMHLHVNPFQVLDAHGQPERAWRDLVNVPAGDRVRIRVRFRDFEGTTVQHCHILAHEDNGMMATVLMVKEP